MLSSLCASWQGGSSCIILLPTLRLSLQGLSLNKVEKSCMTCFHMAHPPSQYMCSKMPRFPIRSSCVQGFLPTGCLGNGEKIDNIHAFCQCWGAEGSAGLCSPSASLEQGCLCWRLLWYGAAATGEKLAMSNSWEKCCCRTTSAAWEMHLSSAPQPGFLVWPTLADLGCFWWTYSALLAQGLVHGVLHGEVPVCLCYCPHIFSVHSCWQMPWSFLCVVMRTE